MVDGSAADYPVEGHKMTKMIAYTLFALGCRRRTGEDWVTWWDWQERAMD